VLKDRIMRREIFLVTVGSVALWASFCLSARCDPNFGPSPDGAGVTDASSPDAATDANAAWDGGSGALSMVNLTSQPAVVAVAFGSDSVVGPPNWSFCTASTSLNCQFTLLANASQHLPLVGQYLNATFVFESVVNDAGTDASVGCGTTKAELNVNNPNWYDIIDISLVDGYSTALGIIVANTLDGGAVVNLGPVTSASGNEKAFGVYPLGCDICVARQKPSCGRAPGSAGCKKGPDQYHPDVPCQYQGSVMGGGESIVTVTYLGG
jgi:hypothetical protein